MVEEPSTPGAGSRRAGRELRAAPLSVGEARGFVAEMLQVWGCDDPDDVAVLLTSELVSNAIRFASEEVALHIRLNNQQMLVVETGDDNPTQPAPRHVASDHEGGRGLLLVEALARRWGVCTRPDGGKVVWFEVPVVPASPEAGRISADPSDS